MTTLILSIDTEALPGAPFDTYEAQVLGQTDAGEWGIDTLMSELKFLQFPATFFLNVYDDSVWGEAAIRKAAGRIVSRGFDLQLHTHVEHSPFDAPGIRGISQLSLERQRAMIAEGCRRMERWVGRRPRWHRAGNLYADRRTIDACREEGIEGDASFLWGWPQCARLVEEVQSRNALQERGGILELPITTYQTLRGVANYRPLDLEHCILGEFVSVIRQAIRGNLEYVVVLMHSSSLLTRTGAGYTPNRERIGVFRSLLHFAGNCPGLKVGDVGGVTRSSLPSMPQRATLRAGYGLTYRRAWAHRGRSWKHRLFLLVPWVAVLALLAAMAVWRLNSE